jgi:precorrin-6Y C5,15-methyltransferase (decarboxylating)
VGIEWLRTHPTTTATAIEADGERAARIGRNAHSLGIPRLVVVEGRAPEALAGLPTPDAVFVGGGVSRPGVLGAVVAAVRPGGRVVAHGVTLETEALLARAYAEHGGELTRLQVETAAPIGSFTGWTPARAITQWSWTQESAS